MYRIILYTFYQRAFIILVYAYTQLILNNPTVDFLFSYFILIVFLLFFIVIYYQIALEVKNSTSLLENRKEHSKLTPLVYIYENPNRYNFKKDI